MKTRLLITLFLIPGMMAIQTGESFSQSEFRLQNDSTYLNVYDSNNESWELSGVVYNEYDLGLLINSVTANSDRIPTAMTEYIYQNTRLDELRSYSSINGSWTNDQHHSFFYDGNGLLAERLVMRWYNNAWVNLNKFAYSYDEDDRLIVYNREVWRNSVWTDLAADSSFYNEDGQLVERSARLKSTGEYLTRQLYQYDVQGRKNQQLRQDFINDEWININRTFYYYDNCGAPSFTETEQWLDGEWQTATRSEIFNSYEFGLNTDFIPVCLKGRTRYIPLESLDRFLTRGACPGECIEEAAESKGFTNADIQKDKACPFVVYPNPARERITVKMTDYTCPVTEIVLMDYYGRVIKTLFPRGSTELQIDLINLRKGNYILKLTADTVYSTIISKQ
ncbi:MAG: T9SS type A sorting domain-containing protein [Bacteroidales bacterium]|nr:T9SS type A sorting domain-containing protein [Bacteroidales bacterium]NMD04049.1 T9SS type A sorting domain-containing protein [Bacteroidales bacterium]